MDKSIIFHLLRFSLALVGRKNIVFIIELSLRELISGEMIDCQNAIGRSAGSFSSIVPLGCRLLQRKSLREDNDDCIRRRLSGAAAAFRWASFPIRSSSMCADPSEIRDAEQNWFIIRELYTIYHFNIRLSLSFALRFPTNEQKNQFSNIIWIPSPTWTHRGDTSRWFVWAFGRSSHGDWKKWAFQSLLLALLGAMSN